MISRKCDVAQVQRELQELKGRMKDGNPTYDAFVKRLLEVGNDPDETVRKTSFWEWEQLSPLLVPDPDGGSAIISAYLPLFTSTPPVYEADQGSSLMMVGRRMPMMRFLERVRGSEVEYGKVLEEIGDEKGFREILGQYRREEIKSRSLEEVGTFWKTFFLKKEYLDEASSELRLPKAIATTGISKDVYRGHNVELDIEGRLREIADEWNIPVYKFRQE